MLAELGGIAVAVAVAELEVDELVADVDKLELVGFCEEVDEVEVDAVEEVDDVVEDWPRLHCPFWQL